MHVFAHFDVEERGLGDVEMSLCYQRLHVAEEEGQQQSANVRAVNVGVAHDYDASVAQFCHVEMFAHAYAYSRDDIFHFLVGEHLVEAGAFHIQDFPS